MTTTDNVDMEEKILPRSLWSRIKVKSQLIWRVLYYKDFIMIAEKEHEVSFMSTVSAEEVLWHLTLLKRKFEGHIESEDAVNSASNIINGIK